MAVMCSLHSCICELTEQATFKRLEGMRNMLPLFCQKKRESYLSFTLKIMQPYDLNQTLDLKHFTSFSASNPHCRFFVIGCYVVLFSLIVWSLLIYSYCKHSLGYFLTVCTVYHSVPLHAATLLFVILLCLSIAQNTLHLSPALSPANICVCFIYTELLFIFLTFQWVT